MVVCIPWQLNKSAHQLQYQPKVILSCHSVWNVWFLKLQVHTVQLQFYFVLPTFLSLFRYLFTFLDQFLNCWSIFKLLWEHLRTEICIIFGYEFHHTVDKAETFNDSNNFWEGRGLGEGEREVAKNAWYIDGFSIIMVFLSGIAGKHFWNETVQRHR